MTRHAGQTLVLGTALLIGGGCGRTADEKKRGQELTEQINKWNKAAAEKAGVSDDLRLALGVVKARNALEKNDPEGVRLAAAEMDVLGEKAVQHLADTAGSAAGPKSDRIAAISLLGEMGGACRVRRREARAGGEGRGGRRGQGGRRPRARESSRGEVVHAQAANAVLDAQVANPAG